MQREKVLKQMTIASSFEKEDAKRKSCQRPGLNPGPRDPESAIPSACQIDQF